MSLEPAPAPRLRGWTRIALVQPLLWLALGALVYGISTHPGGGMAPDQGLIRSLGWAGGGLGVGLLLAGLMGWLGLGRRRLAPSLGLATVLSLAGCVLWFCVDNLFLGLMGHEGHIPFAQLRPTDWSHGTFHRAVTLLLWSAAGLVIVLSEAAARTRELLAQAQVAQLRAQLNPHFLFNSLNAAMALVEEDAEAARTVLLRLSQLLRQTLSDSEVQRVPLSREIELVRRYLEIEGIRFEGDLVVTEQVQAEAMAWRLPPFLVLPLVENAVKHGLRTGALPLRVHLLVEVRQGRLHLILSNTGRLEPGDGLGLRTLRARLAQELGARARFSLEQREDRVVATLVIEGGP